jgi:hypothetical protein
MLSNWDGTMPSAGLRGPPGAAISRLGFHR